MNSKEERAQFGFTLFMDAYEGRFFFADIVASGSASAEIRLAIFYALHGRYANPQNSSDVLLTFSDEVTAALNLIKAKAEQHLKRDPAAAREGVNFEGLTPIAVSMRKMADAPADEQLGRRHAKGFLADLQADNRAMARRDAFNSQHKPAPEGTVKELAARYGKSLSEIRKLKAENKLHTLVEPGQTATAD